MKNTIKDFFEGKPVVFIGEDAIETFALELKPLLTPGCVIALDGDLGTGKTTFVKALARAFGVSQTVKSPSFVYMYVYDISCHHIFKKLVHVDAYRFDKNISEEKANTEFSALGLDEYVGRDECLVCIEWPNIFKKLLPLNTLYIKCEYGENENSRIFQLEK